MNLLTLLLLGAVILIWIRLAHQAGLIQRVQIDLELLRGEMRRPVAVQSTARASVVMAEPSLAPMPVPVVSAPDRETEQKPVLTPPPRLPERREATVSSAPSSVPPSVSAGGWRLPEINWELFLGVKLFAWLGGLALFFAAAFLIKYSFDHDLVPPVLRVLMGYAAGAGLMLGGGWLWRREYRTLASTLVGTGVVVLYAVTFACHAHYRFAFFTVVPTFLLMACITVIAFFLAIRMRAQVVAVLGLLGGFLTPALVNSGTDNPVGLFGYVLILDLGLFAVIWNRRWTVLSTLAAVATVGMQLGWIFSYYAPEKLVVLQVVQPLVVAVFAAFYVAMQRGGRGDRWVTAAFLVPAVFALCHGFGLTLSGAGDQPVRLFTLWLAVDALVLAAFLIAGGPRGLDAAMGAVVFLLLTVWTVGFARAEFLRASLVAYVVFAVLHTVLPLMRLRRHPEERPGMANALFPAAALVLFALPVVRDTGVLPVSFWLGMLGVIALALMLAAFTGALLSAAAVVVVSLGVTALTFLRRPFGVPSWEESLAVVLAFAAVFVGGGWWLSRRREPVRWGFPMPLGLPTAVNDPRLSIAGSGAVLPFLLLTMLVGRAGAGHLESFVGVTSLLVALVLGVAWRTGFAELAALGLMGATLVEAAWLTQWEAAAERGMTLGWYAATYALFTAFPFLVERPAPRRRLPWYVGAAAAPLHFLLVYELLRNGQQLTWPGLIPAAFALPVLGVLAWLARHWPTADPRRLGVLSVQGGVALLLLTLVFPIQFDREWLTVSWALEGVALLWLFRRLPHPGLRLTALALLAVAFGRLMLNPAIFDYHPRSLTRIWNWYLYTYLVVAAAQFLAARLVTPPAHQIQGVDVRGFLRAAGVILLFALLNLEIADYFAQGEVLTFEFSGNFARDLCYTIGWGLFALGLLIGGLWKASRPTRYAGLGLLVVTLVKLFLHDLARLDQLYRIGAFAGVAVIAIAASFLYQRFLNASKGVR